MAVTTLQVPYTLLPGEMVTAFTVTYGADADLTTGAVAHGMLFTPSVLAVFPITAPISIIIPVYISVAVTATTFTAVKSSGGADTASVWRVILGRFPSAS